MAFNSSVGWPRRTQDRMYSDSSWDSDDVCVMRRPIFEVVDASMGQHFAEFVRLACGVTASKSYVHAKKVNGVDSAIAVCPPFALETSQAEVRYNWGRGPVGVATFLTHPCIHWTHQLASSAIQFVHSLRLRPSLPDGTPARLPRQSACPSEALHVQPRPTSQTLVRSPAGTLEAGFRAIHHVPV